MRIAFVSYEYPPDTGVGGIATYIRQVSQLFSARKVSVEVICASPSREGTTIENEFLSVTRIRCANTEEFRELSPPCVAGIHQLNPFDLIEVPEYGAEGLHMKEHLPNVPLIVKLHTPRFLIKELNDRYYDQLPLRKFKQAIGMKYKRSNDPEYQAIRFADHILSPSRSLIDIVSKRWDIPRERILLAPNPYFPSEDLLSLEQQANAKTVLYVGRLETRKGVFNLAKAVPLVASAIPGVKFIFLGKDSRGPRRESSMKKVLLHEMGDAAPYATFIDHIPLTEIPSVFARSSICVFPSLWENFPNVCLEAMTAARAVVASEEGGMKDMLEDTGGAIFINPNEPSSIANAIVELLNNHSLQLEGGKKNRAKAVGYYGGTLAGELLDIYKSFL